MKLACITLALALLIPTAQAQFGGLKVPGMGPVTVESLMGDINSGMDFFGKAAEKYKAALKEAGALVEGNDNAEANNDKANRAGAVGVATFAVPQLTAAAKKLIQDGVVLNEKTTQLLGEGDTEMVKGVAKWGVLAVAIAKAKKDGSSDGKLAAAILAAEQAVKDLPSLKEMYETMKQLKAKKKSKD